jgi:hypothetical protein
MDRAKNVGAPRKLWDSLSQGTAIRVVRNTPNGLDVSYQAKPPVKVKKHQLTEAEDNAAGHAARRRQHRLERGWLPFAKR